jgi:hypothetical protein
VNAEPTPVSYARIETAALDEKRRFAWDAAVCGGAGGVKSTGCRLLPEEIAK